VVNQQLHVDDGQTHTLARDPLTMDGSQAQARILAKLHGPPRVESQGEPRWPHRFAVKIRMDKIAQAVVHIEGGEIAGTEVNLKVFRFVRIVRRKGRDFPSVVRWIWSECWRMADDL
jgi:hypothetical protein